MKLCTIPKAVKVILIAGLFLAMTCPVSAHVELDYPNGGEQFTEGEVIAVEWHVLIEHQLLNWDLWFSVTSSTGPWEEIAVDLPLGVPDAGEHSYL